MLLQIQAGQYVIITTQVSDMDTTDPKSWTVYMASGREYTIEGKDLKAFKEAMGIAA